MKQLTCEMCGGTDLIKDGGVFICQTCGCKYSVEEAKKMMVEGTVDIKGTVQVDNSAFVEKYLANARRAKEKEDWEEVEKYYNMVEQNDPDNIEAIFYSAYGKAKTSLTSDDIYKRESVFNVLKNCISVVDDHYSVERRNENLEALDSIATDLGKMINSTFVYTEWKNGYGVVTKTNKDMTIRLFGSLIDAFRETIDNIQKMDDQPVLHKIAIKLYTYAKKTGYWKESLFNQWISLENEELEHVLSLISEAYWKEHPEEKIVLENEKASIESQIKEYNNKIISLNSGDNIRELVNEINFKNGEKNRLGLFKKEEKKAMQEQIDSLRKQLEEKKKENLELIDETKGEIEILKERLYEIQKQLKRDLD